jgi:hypothetical protein
MMRIEIMQNWGRGGGGLQIYVHQVGLLLTRQELKNIIQVPIPRLLLITEKADLAVTPKGVLYSAAAAFFFASLYRRCSTVLSIRPRMPHFRFTVYSRFNITSQI